MNGKTTAAGNNIGEFDCCCFCCAKDDIRPATACNAAIGTNDQISEAIAVDIASRADGGAASVVFTFTMDDKAAAAGSDVGELNGRGVVCCAKDDIGTA